jgi:hypothetical protein
MGKMNQIYLLNFKDMNDLMKGMLTLCLLMIMCGFSYEDANGQGKYYQIEGFVAVKFNGEAVRTYCRSALGEVTSFKYDPQLVAKDSNYICEVSVYKNVNADSLKDKDVDFFEYIIASEEMSMNELNGKFEAKKDTVFNGLPAKVLRVYFSDLRTKNIQECINSNIYFKHENQVFKVSTYLSVRGKADIASSFFDSVKFFKEK